MPMTPDQIMADAEIETVQDLVRNSRKALRNGNESVARSHLRNAKRWIDDALLTLENKPLEQGKCFRKST